MEFKKYSYKTVESVFEELKRLGLDLPYSKDVNALLKPSSFAGKKMGNSIVLQPLEGCDANETGGPGDLTKRRYLRFAKGGSGLIWFEATAIDPEGRAQARQLILNEKNVDEYARLVEEIKETGLKENGYAPVVIHQLTHSGRYSRPNGDAAPWIARNNPLLEKDHPIAAERIVTDEMLEKLEQRYYTAAKLSQKAGFDGADVKACHGYLGSELLAGFTRENSRYGGSYENRTRFLKNSLLAVKSAVEPDYVVTTRLSLCDYFPFPYAFGVKQEEGSREPDLTEPLRLIDELKALIGLKGLNVSIASPYVNPHVSRPYDRGGYEPDEHPLEGVARFDRLIREAQEKNPDLDIINVGFSYLREYAPNFAAGALEAGIGKLAGFGRLLFADPDMPRQLRDHGKIEKSDVCVSCSLCTDHLRKGICTGCWVRDREIYKD